MKYEISQKVRLKPLSECKEKNIPILEAMKPHFCKEHDVFSINRSDGHYKLYSIELHDWWMFQEDWIECAVDEKKDPIDLEIERLQNLKKAEIVQKEIDELQEKIDNKIKEFYELIGGLK